MEPKFPADEYLPVEAILGEDHIVEGAECHSAPGGDVEHGQGIVGAEEQLIR